jgi:probable rRNA maturation factor
VKSKPRDWKNTEGRPAQGVGRHPPAFELSVREEGGSLPVSRTKLVELTALAFRLTGREPGDVSLVVAGDGFIAALNEKYLGESGPTDVLSFCLRDEDFREGLTQREPQRLRSEEPAPRPTPGQQPPRHPGLTPWGDIVISVETAELQARSGAVTLADEFQLLYLHGLLHLLGYTHDEEEDRARMDEVLRTILSGGHTAR